MEQPVPPLSTRARWVLRIALVIAWAVGVAGTASSCQLLMRYREPVPHKTSSVALGSAAPSVPSTTGVASIAPSVSVAPTIASAPAPAPSISAAPAVAPRPGLLTEAEKELVNEAFERYRKTRLPLTAANLVLSIALVIGAARTIGRRPGGRVWLQQVCFATVLYAGAEHFLTRAERSFLVDGMAKSRASQVNQPGVSRQETEAAIRATLQTSLFLKLLVQVGLFGGLAIALGRKSVEQELSPRNAGRPSIPPSSTDDGDL